MALNAYRHTIAYSLCSLDPNDPRGMKHSQEWLDNHPERKDNPYFTEDEKEETAKFMLDMAKRF